jgi:hypothetical protein
VCNDKQKGDKKMATRSVSEEDYLTPVHITASQAKKILNSKRTHIKPTTSAMWNIRATQKEKDEFIARVMRKSERGRN